MLAVAAVQGATLLGLVVVDYRREAPQACRLPRLPPSSVTAGASASPSIPTVNRLYRDMLNAIGEQFADLLETSSGKLTRLVKRSRTR